MGEVGAVSSVIPMQGCTGSGKKLEQAAGSVCRRGGPRVTGHWPRKRSETHQEAELEVLSIEGDKAFAFWVLGCFVGCRDSSDS